jgi:hypothetical protein
MNQLGRVAVGAKRQRAARLRVQASAYAHELQNIDVVVHAASCSRWLVEVNASAAASVPARCIAISACVLPPARTACARGALPIKVGGCAA